MRPRHGVCEDALRREWVHSVSDDTVIIVGAGSVGLATAVGLARAGVAVQVIEAAQAAPTGARDVVYHWSVMEGFDRLGLLEPCKAQAMWTDSWTYVVRRTGEHIRFDLSTIADVVAHPYNLHIGQQTITEVFLAQLERHGGTVEWGATVTAVAQDGDGVTVIAENDDGAHTYRAEWVVGADGARSIVRRDLGLAFAGITWPDRFVATNLRFDLGSIGFDTAGYQIDPTLGAVVAQVDVQGLWRYIFAENRTLPEEMIDERVRAVLQEILPGGGDPLVDNSYPYRIHQRSAERFRVGRAVLVGDAAHLTNPTLGLGMTSGLADAYALVEALSAMIVDGHSEEILDLYSQMRYRNFWDYTSPVSTEAKGFVFPFGGSEQDDELDTLRSVVADPDALRRYLLDGAGCITPSLLTAADPRA
jgi:3-(3-hydroxy-phenyl)propionate hydroxylase/6-hydroxy-3-succinoylpyridine 3-monooxygenase